MKVVLASANPGKLQELRFATAGWDWELIPMQDLQIASPEETGLTFVENALLKARHASAESGLPALADDSGLSVAALGGAPGLYSARYAGKEASDVDNVSKLLGALRDVPSGAARRAEFVCSLAFVRHPEDPVPVLGEGYWQGEVTMQPCGDNGFGYDPVFWVPTAQCTAAQLSAEQKKAISHRSQAWADFTRRWQCRD